MSSGESGRLLDFRQEQDFMGTARSLFFIIASIIMIISGICALIVLAILMNDSIYRHSSSSYLIITICTGLIIVCSVLDIISGITGLKFSNKRSNSAIVIRIPQIAVLLCLIAVILFFINGVKAWHICIIIFTGIVIPEIYMFAAIRKSYTASS